MVTVENIKKSFGNVTAVDGLSFSIQPGDIVGFLGPNGAGKTTTMRIITGFIAPDSGNVMVGGFPVAEKTEEAQRLIGYLPENNPLYQEMLVADILALSANLHRITKAERQRTFDFVVSATDIGDVFYRPIRELSKGYRQRVGIALALLHKPRIIIMDEPTEGLDPNQRAEIRALIKELAKERTIMMSTHVMQEATAVCNRLIVIAHGQLVADGSPQEVTRLAHAERILNFEAEGRNVSDIVKGISGVQRVDIEREHDGRVSLKIELDTKTTIQPELSRLARDNGWTIWHLAEEEHSLEDVFHQLTKSK